MGARALSHDVLRPPSSGAGDWPLPPAARRLGPGGIFLLRCNWGSAPDPVAEGQRCDRRRATPSEADSRLLRGGPAWGGIFLCVATGAPPQTPLRTGSGLG